MCRFTGETCFEGNCFFADVYLQLLFCWSASKSHKSSTMLVPVSRIIAAMDGSCAAWIGFLCLRPDIHNSQISSILLWNDCPAAESLRDWWIPNCATKVVRKQLKAHSQMQKGLKLMICTAEYGRGEEFTSELGHWRCFFARWSSFADIWRSRIRSVVHIKSVEWNHWTGSIEKPLKVASESIFPVPFYPETYFFMCCHRIVTPVCLLTSENGEHPSILCIYMRLKCILSVVAVKTNTLSVACI